MKQAKNANIALVAMLILCTVMLCVIYSYSENTITKANRTNAVAAFNL